MSEAKPATRKPGSGDDDLSALRRLLLSPEQRRIEELAAHIEDPARRADDLAEVLPEALRLGSERDAALGEALTPTVETIIHESVRRDSQRFADALFPVIGPAIRKAITETLRQMLQNLSEMLEHSFSRRGLAWRFEAWRTGRPFAEVVLLHSLVFRVEQVFLIHRESGVLLQHLSAPDVTFEDADLVSAMLTAIQDFVHDSFAVDGDQALDGIQMGDLTVWVEQGPEAVIAGAIRGNAPAELRGVFREALEDIHRRHGEALRHFSGDPAPFETDEVQQALQPCLQARYVEQPRRISPLVIAMLLALFAAGGWWAYVELRDRQAFEAYLQRLDAAPGIVVTRAGEDGDGYRVQGLRDPLAVQPATLLDPESPLAGSPLRLDFEPYQALVPAFVLARAERLLQPPAAVTLDLEGTTLRISGQAPAGWITEARRLAPALPGITAVDTRGLRDESQQQLRALRDALTRQVVLFDVNTARGEADAETLRQLARDLKRLHGLALKLELIPQVTLVGHSDSTGSAQRNRILSQRRAEWLREQLLALGVPPALLTVRGAGSSEPVSREDSDEGRARNRSVTLDIDLMPTQGPSE